MVRRWMCGVVVVAILGALGWSAPVMAKQPSDYYGLNNGGEFLYAEMGAIVGGAVGLVGSGWVPGVAEAIDEKALYDWPGWVQNLIFWNWTLGRAVGAGLGTTLAGSEFGVQGNVFMAYFLPGVFLSAFPILSAISPTFLRDLGLPSELVLALVLVLAAPHLPFVPAVLAVIGYNIGAKMKDTGQPASLPWSLDLPVLPLEF